MYTAKNFDAHLRTYHKLYPNTRLDDNDFKMGKVPANLLISREMNQKAISHFVSQEIKIN